MNERLRELMVQADYPAPEIALRAQKLAELIVVEMLKTCEEHPGWYGRDIGKQIKQHFGVSDDDSY